MVALDELDLILVFQFSREANADIAAARNELVIAIEYDASGLAQAAMTDYSVLGWLIDETAAATKPPAASPALEPSRRSPIFIFRHA